MSNEDKMEEKKEAAQTGNESDNAKASTDSASAAPTGNGVADKIIADVKKFNLMSLIGLGLVAAFLLFMFFSGVKFKWWLMLPMAGAAAFILYRQLSDTQGFEKKVCYYALITIGVLVLLRDIHASNNAEGFIQIQDRMKSAMTQMNTQMKAATDNLKKLKVPGMTK